ncbi:hypothetical protein VQ02_08395 [Methylobacterium variabile]|jgi:hypothetical protein|uniref:Translation initiation factor 2 n=1 Tax=Methylobacterium variabile TaxID=298794 RepID=A0A0J6T3M5_9HYPH|nr:hypothetical protein [Methylobacterium variabile]KMO40203.1 hypothetical protein VQ02_08395 [Methylobacterium variabile]
MPLIAACLSFLALTACGTVTRGTTEQVTFLSEPPGAAMRTSLGPGCPVTPCTLEVARKQEFVSTFSPPGHADVQVPVTTKLSGSGGASMAGNLVAGGLIGAGIDAHNGTAYDHTPNPVIGHMVPLTSAPAARGRRRAAPQS